MKRAVCALSLMLPVVALATSNTQTDVLGGQGQSNSGSGSYKTNTIQVGQAVQLDEIEFHLDPQQANMNAHFLVYQDVAGAWNLLYDSGAVAVSQGAGWKSHSGIATVLDAGEYYAIGVYLPPGNDTTYWYEDVGDEGTGWGQCDGSLFAFNDTVFSAGPPNTISWPDGATEDFHYYERLTISFGEDVDGDGVGSLSDCDDNDAAVFPGNTEACDGIDNDCNGQVDDDVVYLDYWPDTDGDGFGDGEATPTASCEGALAGFVDNAADCNDAVAAVYPGAEEVCDGIDNDCDGELGPGEGIDTDLDGFPICDDCDDGNAETYPGAEDSCNGVDNDCDGVIPPDDSCDPFSGEDIVADGCGCAHGAGSTGAGVWLGLMLLGWRRRR